MAREADKLAACYAFSSACEATPCRDVLVRSLIAEPRSLQAAVVFASLVLVIASAACADADADAIINKGIKALGGEEKLVKAKATTSKVKSTFISGDIASVSKIEHTTDGLGRMRMTFEADFDGNKFVSITVIDGDKGWVKEGEREVVELQGKELADEVWGFFWQSVPDTLVELKDPKFKTEVVGDVKVDGKPADGVKVTGPGGKDFVIYFDKKTGLPVVLVRSSTGIDRPVFV